MAVSGSPRLGKVTCSEPGNGESATRAGWSAPMPTTSRARVTRDLVAVVVVHAQHVDRGRDDVEVTVAHHVEPGPVLPRPVGGVLEHVDGVGAAEDRVEEEPVVHPVDPAGGVDVDRVACVARVGHRQVEAQPEPVGAAAAQLLRREAVREQQVVTGDETGGPLLATRRVVARGVAEERRAPRLVEGGPRRHPVAERLVHRDGVLRRTGGRCRGWSSRRRPRAPAAGPSGRASATARSRGRAARRRAGRRTRGRPR